MPISFVPNFRASQSLERRMKAILLIAALVLSRSLWASTAMAAESYLARLRDAIILTPSKLAAIGDSAGLAAAEHLAGGNIWVAGRQPDFMPEATGRAGGLIAMASLDPRGPSEHDIVLYAVPGTLEQDDLKRVDSWRQRGAVVVTFSSPTGCLNDHFPIDTVANVVDLWIWTGEFVAACTRLGKMPVLYQSYGLPGGPERGQKYQGRKFHDDLTVQPIGAGVLGREYVDQIQRMLSSINETQMPKILEAARWWNQAASAMTLFTGHMFPSHAQDPRAIPASLFAAVPAGEDRELLETDNPPEFVLYLGYQLAPQRLLVQARTLGVNLVYSDVLPAQPPEPSGNILYIDPAWPLADGCVTVPGYDVPILPASGVVQAALYWTIAYERASLGEIDSDKDGVSDLSEFLAGTDPTSSASVLRLTGPIEQTDRAVRFEWPSSARRKYLLEMSHDLTSWVTATDHLQGTGGTLSTVLSTLDPRLHSFFRVKVFP